MEDFERNVIDRLARIEQEISDIKIIEKRLALLEQFMNQEKGKEFVRNAICCVGGAVSGASVGILSSFLV